jgi:iron(III) transport system substrate-binding protein
VLNRIHPRISNLRLKLVAFALIAAFAVLSFAACGGDDEGGGEHVITIYVGRSQNLVEPLFNQFVKDTGIKLRIRYGDGTDLALALLEEGDKSNVDVYYGQDVGALGALKAENRLAKLPDSILNKVDASFHSKDGWWVGVSGRRRVMVYNTDNIDPKTLPESALDYTAPKWKGKVGIVPRSDGFPEFITALRLVKGEDYALQFLQGLKANNVRTYANNIAAIQAVANKEIDVAFLNHYYLYRFLKEQGEGFKARNYFFDNGDLGGLFLVSGAAVLKTSKNQSDAQKFIEYLLGPAGQTYFANNDFEYPLVEGTAPDPQLPPIKGLKTPNIDLSDLDDLKGSLELMRKAGIVP